MADPLVRWSAAGPDDMAIMSAIFMDTINNYPKW